MMHGQANIKSTLTVFVCIGFVNVYIIHYILVHVFYTDSAYEFTAKLFSGLLIRFAVACLRFIFSSVQPDDGY